MNAADYVETRAIGDAQVTVISEETTSVPLCWVFDVPEPEWRAALPDVPAGGTALFGQNVIHIALNGASILVDVGFDSPDSAWGRRHAEEMKPRRTPGTLAGLASRGVRPEEITHVLITHAHSDHLIGIATEDAGEYLVRYPQARHLLQRADRLTNSDPGAQARLAALGRAGLLDLADGDVAVVPGVSLLHAPGESPGHAVVRLTSAGRSFYALGDLFHHPVEVEHLDWMSARRDRAAMTSSRERILREIAASDATAVFTHAPFPPWGRVARTARGFRWIPA